MPLTQHVGVAPGAGGAKKESLLSSLEQKAALPGVQSLTLSSRLSCSGGPIELGRCAAACVEACCQVCKAQPRERA